MNAMATAAKRERIDVTVHCPKLQRVALVRGANFVPGQEFDEYDVEEPYLEGRCECGDWHQIDLDV